MKFLLAISVLFYSISSFSANILMYENGVALNPSHAKIFVNGPEIIIRSEIMPCSSYLGFPDKVYGDVYECVATRYGLANYLEDNSVLTQIDPVLANDLNNRNLTITCNTTIKPILIPYQGKNVYLFSGTLYEANPGIDF